MNSTLLALRKIVAVALLAGVATPAKADIFLLHTGGQVVGEPVVADAAAAPGVYVIRTAAGVQVTLEKTAVKQIIPQNAAEPEYLKAAPAYPDTPAGQWELAEWCAERGLTKQRQTHLERVLQLDPDHKGARQSLGFAMVDGKWLKANKILEERGYVMYRGRMRLPQEVEIMERRRKQEVAEREWFAKLKIWHNTLDTARGVQSRAHIEAIEDPNAVPALVNALQNEKSRPVRVMFVQVLAKINSPAALSAMVSISLDDRDPELRLTCLDHLMNSKSHEVVSQYAQALKSKDNVRINRAALALGKIKDPTAVSPLIDALVTQHKFMHMPANPGSTSATFGDGGAGLSSGGTARIERRNIANQDVLDALIATTKMNFAWDVKAWKNWYARQQRAGAMDARRD